MTDFTRVRRKGQVTIPASVRRATKLEEGDPIEVEVVPEGILLRPRKLIDATQSWFWAPEWQAGEREASEQHAAGKGTIHESGEELLTALRRRSNSA